MWRSLRLLLILKKSVTYNSLTLVSGTDDGRFGPIALALAATCRLPGNLRLSGLTSTYGYPVLTMMPILALSHLSRSQQSTTLQKKKFPSAQLVGFGTICEEAALLVFSFPLAEVLTAVLQLLSYTLCAEKSSRQFRRATSKLSKMSVGCVQNPRARPGFPALARKYASKLAPWSSASYDLL
jgi:hypothetical protein